ncbi:MAG: hypothetical protein JWR03_1953 [Cohnella sp.]|jgi:hypothetical protein|nr:hypothetical protein [Cohnella sp.]
MNRYVKLVLMEMHRFWKLYAALILVTLVSQLGGLYLTLRKYMNGVNGELTLNPQTYTDYASRFGKLPFEIAMSRAALWIFGPVVLCIAALLLYVFLIWYRDWLGKNTFAYRLLMLPTARMNLFWSKLTAVITFVLGLVALQIVLLPVHLTLYRTLIPAALRPAESPLVPFVRHDPIFRTLVPPTFLEFILYYGAGVLAVTIVFTAILLERSFRLKGLVGGILYTVAAAAILVSPIILVTSGADSLAIYPMELFLLELGLGVILLAVSLGLSRYLMNRKITV